MTQWPSLNYASWVETRDTLHLFLQMIGKVRLKTHPKLNHWWHVTLYPHVRGLTTGRIPFQGSGFEIFFDMIDHTVIISRNDGRQTEFAVSGLTVAAFYWSLMSGLSSLGVEVRIVATPYDNKSKTPFPEDDAPRIYDPAAVSQFWRALCSISSVFENFRAKFVGKQTPVQLYWHSFDLVVTRFRALSLYSGSYPQAVKSLAHSVGVMASSASATALCRSGTVRAAALRSRALSLEKAFSMGLKSGL